MMTMARRALATALFLAASLTTAVGQVPSFPQTLPANTVVGRLGIGPGPSQAIPISRLFTQALGPISTAAPLSITGVNTSGAETITGLFLDRIYGSVGDRMDLTWGTHGTGVNTTPRAAAISAIAIGAGEMALDIFTQTGTGDAYSNRVARLAAAGLTAFVPVISPRIVLAGQTDDGSTPIQVKGADDTSSAIFTGYNNSGALTTTIRASGVESIHGSFVGVNAVQPGGYTTILKVIDGSDATPITDAGAASFSVYRTQAIVTAPAQQSSAIYAEVHGHGGVVGGPASIGQPVGINSFVVNETDSKSDIVAVQGFAFAKGTGADSKAAFGGFFQAEAVAGAGALTAAIAVETQTTNSTVHAPAFSLAGSNHYIGYDVGMTNSEVGSQVRGQTQVGFAVLNSTVSLAAFISPGFKVDPTGIVTAASYTNNLSAFAATTSAQLAGVLSDETGSGLAVFNNTPTLLTPVLTGLPTGTGVATANTVSTLVARDGSGNFSAGTITAALTGNASTATGLQNARTIGGVSFNGTANITVASATGGFTVSGGDIALGTNNITMTGSLGATGARLTKGWFTDLQVTNAIAGSVTGNAATATALQTGRAINGTTFDGTAAITVTAAAGTLTGGQVPLARGGTNADLSATGGTSQVVRQSSTGAALTVSQLATTDLSDVSSGTFTPVLTFGGGSTGITYSTQEGSYYKRGKTVFVRFRMALSSKGSSTGAVSISGLPATSGSHFSTLSAYVGAVASTASGHWQIGVNIGSTTMFAQYILSGSVQNADDTTFTNGTDIWGTGWYESASWLMKRDLDPAANDNTPMFMNAVA